ncbi:MAG: pantetheine-phosphate adenylyltransferase [Erysipelotrichaceae bacterium]|nr:MAG: pantetheine-phosphate [Erysipelotrichaceae bacterium]TXT16454.1 MAG: pantetheine-phosphate adenylyltransferase [Erysipelotrichaceae bacterium]
MIKALYPGSFDPLTNGHLDVIKRASAIFDELEVVIMTNPNKAFTFSIEERIEMLESVITKFSNVTISAQSGLTVDYAQKVGATVLVRGIRAVMDYEYELQQATANMILNPDVETIFLLTHPQWSFLSSSVVKQVALNHGDLTSFIPPEIKDVILKKYLE